MGGRNGGQEVFRQAVQVVQGRWFMVFASSMIMAAAGATYLFGIYSKDIKTSLGYNQQTLNTMSFFKDLGANVGILSGLINEVTPPWVVLAIGSAMNLFGYLMIYLAITGRLSNVKVWQMCLYICVGANSQAFANTGALVTCVKNFPESRGTMLGLQKGYVGLSGAIFTQLYYAFYGSDSKSLVLLIAWLPAAISVAFLRTIRILPVVRQVNELRVFYSFLYISLFFAAYLMIIIICEKIVTFSHAAYRVNAVVIFFILFVPLAVVIREEIALWRKKTQSLHNPTPLSVSIEKPKPEPPAPVIVTVVAAAPPSVLSENSKTKLSSSSCFSNVFNPPERGEDYTILQALFSVDMILLFIATVCGLGGCLTAMDNMGQIAESLGYPPFTIGTFLSLTSIWNYLGRVVAGFCSEIFLTKYKLPRTLMFTLVIFLCCAGHLLIALGFSGSIYVASVIIGFCFGAQLPLLFAIISEIFGLKYYSTLFNFGQVASPVGSYLLNVKVAGYLYDREAEKQKLAGIAVPSTKGKDLTCIGVHCFRHAFFIVAAVTLFGALVSLILTLRTWKFYEGDIYAKFRQAAAEADMEMSLVASKEAVTTRKDREDEVYFSDTSSSHCQSGRDGRMKNRD